MKIVVKRIYGIFIVFFIMVASIITLTPMLSSVGEWIIYGTVLFISGILFIYLSNLGGFALLVTEIITIGTIFVVNEWIHHPSLIKEQSIDIAIQVLFAIILVSLWVISISLKSVLKTQQSLEQQIQVLTKKDEISGTLTVPEFTERLKQMHTGMNRRGETGYFLRIKMNLQNKDLSLPSVVNKISKSILQTMRDDYDLLTQNGNDELLLALQNTSISGVKVVEQRILGSLKDQIVKPDETIIFENRPIPKDWKEINTILGKEEGANF